MAFQAILVTCGFTSNSAIIYQAHDDTFCLLDLCLVVFVVLLSAAMSPGSLFT